MATAIFPCPAKRAVKIDIKPISITPVKIELRRKRLFLIARKITQTATGSRITSSGVDKEGTTHLRKAPSKMRRKK
ncbi:MAG: hypothetical protein ABI691_16420 [Ginsengibacter sp.]